MRIAFFSATLLAASVSLAATPVDGWYSSVFGGFTYLPDDVSISHVAFHVDHAKYNFGYHAGGRVGYQSNPLRYEGEFTYINAQLEKFRVNFLPQLHISGQETAAIGMANVYYDFPDIVPAVSPFLGIGLGYAWIEGTLESRGSHFATTRFRVRESDSVFAYQATAGVTYNFSENYALNIAYRYIGTTRVEGLGKVFQANLATLGVLYRFDQSSYK